MKHLLLPLALVFGPAKAGLASRPVPEGKAAEVRVDFLPVYARPEPGNEPLKTLFRGKTVSILFEVVTSEGLWCQIEVPGEPQTAGFVPCRALIPLRDVTAVTPAPPPETLPGPPPPELPQPAQPAQSPQPAQPAQPEAEKSPPLFLPGTFLRALWEGDSAKVEEMLNEGLDPNLPTGFGTRALIIAAKKKSPAILRLLIDNGADLEGRDPNETTPLIAAAAAGLEENVEILISAGADPDAGDGGGITALSWASIQGFPRVVEILLSCGADAAARSKDGKTALRFSKMILANTQRALAGAAPGTSEETLSRLKSKAENQERVIQILEKAGGRD